MRLYERRTLTQSASLNWSNAQKVDRWSISPSVRVCVCVCVLKITELGQINVPSKKGDFCCQMQKVLQKSEKKLVENDRRQHMLDKREV